MYVFYQPENKRRKATDQRVQNHRRYFAIKRENYKKGMVQEWVEKSPLFRIVFHQNESRSVIFAEKFPRKQLWHRFQGCCHFLSREVPAIGAWPFPSLLDKGY